MAYQDAFHSIDVKGRALEFSSSSITRLSRSDLINDFYFHGNFGVCIDGLDLNNSITFSNDLDRYFKDASTSDYSVEYAGGFDASFIDGTGAVCLLGSGIAKTHGVGPGDKITLLSNNLYLALAERYKDEEDLLTAIEYKSRVYKVAGIIDSDNASIGFGIFASANSAAEDIYGQPFPLRYSEFTLADNERAGDLNDLLIGQIANGRKYAPMASFYMDTAALDNIKHVHELLIMLFPIAVTAAVLIGLTAPGLIIMQSAKEAALLRILGVTKKRTRCMLMFEQIGLCVVGIVLVAGWLALYTSVQFARSAETDGISN